MSRKDELCQDQERCLGDFPSGPEKKRPQWDAYFIEIAHLVAKRSTCRRRAVGAILVRERRMLTTGYNGAPSGLSHCLKIGCLREDMQLPSGERHELCRGLHAEQNAIIQAALHGVTIRGATLYCTNQPCAICAKMIINSQIKKIVYAQGYADTMSQDMLKEANIPLVHFDPDQQEEE